MNILCFCLLFSVVSTKVSSRPATFNQDFRIAFSGHHLKQMDGGTSVQLRMDKNSGCGFASKNKYLFGSMSMKIKLIPGDSAGTVTAFYLNSDTDKTRDELDFEFLGNRPGQPYVVQTNVFVNGKGDKEQRVNLWFDPSKDFHKYTILWNHYQIVFTVDEIPIRVFKNNEAKGVPYPKSQPMLVYSTLWDGSSWATKGGLDKIDWSKAPFFTYYKDFDIEGCVVPGQGSCVSNPKNPWESAPHQRLSPAQAKYYRWVRLKHMTYDYCNDKKKHPIAPAECRMGFNSVRGCIYR